LERSSFTIGEEFRLMDKKKYDEIVRPFATVRQAPYLKDPKYSHLIEEPIEILITSSYYKSLWWYKEMEENIKLMLMGEKSGVIYFDFPIAIKHGIKTKKLILKDKQKMGEISFQQEYENIPYGQNSDAYFQLELFNKNKKIKKVFYPIKEDNVDYKNNKYKIKRKDGEIRVVSVDIATRKGKKNDNTIITCIRALPTKRGYNREYVYMESHQGEHTKIQALRIKQIFYDFEADYISLDLQNTGITIFERLAEVTKDEARGIEYDAYTVMQHKSIKKDIMEELQEKTFAKNAIPIIYPISATAKLNSDIAVRFKNGLKNGSISIPVDSIDGESYLLTNDKNFIRTESIEEKVWYLAPYHQFQEFINETINLSYTIASGLIKLDEGSGRKDRYTSCSYGDWLIYLFELKLLKNDEDDDYNWDDYNFM